MPPQCRLSTAPTAEHDILNSAKRTSEGTRVAHASSRIASRRRVAQKRSPSKPSRRLPRHSPTRGADPWIAEEWETESRHGRTRERSSGSFARQGLSAGAKVSPARWRRNNNMGVGALARNTTRRQQPQFHSNPAPAACTRSYKRENRPTNRGSMPGAQQARGSVPRLFSGDAGISLARSRLEIIGQDRILFAWGPAAQAGSSRAHAIRRFAAGLPLP